MVIIGDIHPVLLDLSSVLSYGTLHLAKFLVGVVQVSFASTLLFDVIDAGYRGEGNAAVELDGLPAVERVGGRRGGRRKKNFASASGGDVGSRSASAERWPPFGSICREWYIGFGLCLLFQLVLGVVVICGPDQ